MSFLRDLFRKGEEPNKVWSDPILGATFWSDEDESWQGEILGLSFTLAYEWKKEPDHSLVKYAREVLLISRVIPPPFGWTKMNINRPVTPHTLNVRTIIHPQFGEREIENFVAIRWKHQ